MSKFSRKFQSILSTISNKIDSLLPAFLKRKNSSSNSIIFLDHVDSQKTISEKIQLEKRKRHQASVALDYILSFKTYFDFFSLDAFQIAKDAKNFAQITKKQVVSSDLLLLPFFYSDSKMAELLKNAGITKEDVELLISQYHISSAKNFQEKSILFLENFFKNILRYSPIDFKEIRPNRKIKYSLEVNRIFEKAAENAFQRFKTPVISTEILFLTLMEEENTRVSKLIKKFFSNETDWLLLRYSLIKRLYKQESSIRNLVPPNQHYFAYLLKTRFSDNEFESLIDTDYLTIGVSAFRNELISEVLKVNIFDLLEEEVWQSIQLNSKKNIRQYSKEPE
jgi:hypothetical protein